MVTMEIYKRYGTAIVESRVSAESIELAVELAGPGARVVFPLDPRVSFAPPTTTTNEGL